MYTGSPHGTRYIAEMVRCCYAAAGVCTIFYFQILRSPSNQRNQVYARARARARQLTPSGFHSSDCFWRTRKGIRARARARVPLLRAPTSLMAVYHFPSDFFFSPYSSIVGEKSGRRLNCARALWTSGAQFV